MSSTKAASNTNDRTQTLQAYCHSYAYRRFGNGSGLPLLFFQLITGTPRTRLPPYTDLLGSDRGDILCHSAGLWLCLGEVAPADAETGGHAMEFLGGLGIKRFDVLGYSLGGM